ncbi:MAG: type II toxin-antitoxin system RelE/ParE family toxin [Coxiellaceae bacterium]|nr:type II toxin-antitoxin system RelE/ParE family toxin [Coxiellaceae bacterium]
MRMFKTRYFAKWARKQRITDQVLKQAVYEMERGLIGSDLGGGVYKKRVAVFGRGKRSGVRVLLALATGRRAIFIFGFAKNRLENIDSDQMSQLKMLASLYLNYSEQQIALAIQSNEVMEV